MAIPRRMRPWPNAQEGADMGLFSGPEPETILAVGSRKEFHFAVKHMGQSEHPVDGLPIVGLVEKPVELCRGRP